MKLYLVETDAGGYDVYDALLVRAESADDALSIAQTDYYRDPMGVFRGMARTSDRDGAFSGFETDRGYTFTVTEATAEGDRGVVIGSYHAG